MRSFVWILALFFMSPISFSGPESWSKSYWLKQIGYFESQIKSNPFGVSSSTWRNWARNFSTAGAEERLKSLGIWNCTQKLREMVAYRAQTFSSRHGGGYNYPSSEYYEKLEAEYPGLFNPPRIFQSGTKDGKPVFKMPSNWKSEFQKHGIKWLRQKPGYLEERIVVHIPKELHENGYEQWYNIAEKQGGKFVFDQLTVIEWYKAPLKDKSGKVQKDASGETIYQNITPKEKDRLVEEGILRTSEARKKFTPFLSTQRASGFGGNLSGPVGTGRCMNCHVSGVISPFIADGMSRYQSSSGIPGAERDTFNQRMQSYGKLDWDHWYSPEKLGPPMRIREDLDNDDYTNENCASCHGTGKSRGILNLAGNKSFMFRRIKSERRMPVDYYEQRNPGSDFTKVESYLNRNYGQQIVDWLNIDACN